MIDEGAPWLESMRTGRTKVATPVSKATRHGIGEGGLLGFNLLPDVDPAPGFGRIGEYRLQLIEYWRRTQRADTGLPDATPVAASRPAPVGDPPTASDDLPTRGQARKQKSAGPIQLPSSSLKKGSAAGAGAKQDQPAASDADGPKRKHPDSFIESINEQIRAYVRDLPPSSPAPSPASRRAAPLPPVRDVLLDPIAVPAPPAQATPQPDPPPQAEAVLPAEPPQVDMIPRVEAPEAVEAPVVAAAPLVDDTPPAAAPEPPRAEAVAAAPLPVDAGEVAAPPPADEPATPERTGWTSAFRSAASSLPSMLAALTSKRQATGLNLKEAMATRTTPEARSEPVESVPVPASDPVEAVELAGTDQPVEESEPAAAIEAEVETEAEALEEAQSSFESDFLPTVDFLSSISAPSVEPDAAETAAMDLQLQDDLMARLQEATAFVSAQPAHAESPNDPVLSIPSDFSIDVEPEMPADWPASPGAGHSALRELAESMDLEAFASIEPDVQDVDNDLADAVSFDATALSDAALEAIDASAFALAAAYEDQPAATVTPEIAPEPELTAPDVASTAVVDDVLAMPEPLVAAVDMPVPLWETPEPAAATATAPAAEAMSEPLTSESDMPVPETPAPEAAFDEGDVDDARDLGALVADEAGAALPPPLWEASTPVDDAGEIREAEYGVDPVAPADHVLHDMQASAPQVVEDEEAMESAREIQMPAPADSSDFIAPDMAAIGDDESDEDIAAEAEPHVNGHGSLPTPLVAEPIVVEPPAGEPAAADAVAADDDAVETDEAMPALEPASGWQEAVAEWVETAPTASPAPLPVRPRPKGGVVQMPPTAAAPATQPTPAPANDDAPAHIINRESVSVRALEGFLKRIETRRREVDKESVA